MIVVDASAVVEAPLHSSPRKQARSEVPGPKCRSLGGFVGFFFALVALAVSVVSFPMLIDRRVGVLRAVKTSFKALETSPMVILAWGFVVASLLVLGALPALLGMIVVMPVLGHATWHLYRRVVD